MKIAIPDRAVGMLASVLSARGYRARLVGGAVRDLACGSVPKDMDLATDALPVAVVDIMESVGLRVVPTGLQHGTVTVIVDGTGYEVTTLRRDVDTDGRHATVEYVSDFREDAARRDFTINAMSADPDGTVHDYFGGLADLSARRVRFVGSADDRISEDYLRILRFFRFRARFGGNEDGEELQAAARGREGLRGISVERVWSEVSRIIVHPRGTEQLSAMSSTGVAETIGLPVAEERLPLAASAAAAGGRPGTVLGILCGRVGLAADVAERWKLSNADAEDASVAAAVLCDPSGDPWRWIGEATDGTDPSRIVPVLLATGRVAAAEGLRRPLPVFPLRGRDFVDAGIGPGPAVGAAMAAAREEWKSSGFTAGRDELLDHAIASATQRRP